MEKHLRNEKVALMYVPKFREYGIRSRTGDTSYQLIKYCPWCGSKLPESLRDKWFDRLEKLGLEPESPDLPKDMTTDEWYKKKST